MYPFVLTLIAGCSDHQITQRESEPEVSFVSPADGEQFPIGSTVRLEAVVDDDDVAEDMVIAWVSSLDYTLEGEAIAEGEDVSLIVSDLSAGGHVITVIVTDPDAHEAEDSRVIEILPNELPTLAFTEPNGEITVLEDETLDLILQASDGDQHVDLGQISWSADSGAVEGDA